MTTTHTHNEKYITRIIKTGDKEWIQFICEKDGEIFKEILITNIACNG